MGQSTSTPLQYGVFTGPEKQGETRILHHPSIGDGAVREVNSFGTRTTWEALERMVTTLNRKDEPFLGTRRKLSKDTFDSKYTWKTYGETKEEAIAFARGLDALKLCPEVNTGKDGVFKFLGIYSRNNEQWVIGDLGAHANSVTVVTIYDTLGDNAMEFIFQQTKLSTILIESKGLGKILLLAKAKRLVNVTNLIVIDYHEDEQKENELKELGINIHSYNDIINTGKASNAEIHPAKPDDVCIICYTSGTTGMPKGAMIQHKALLAEVDILTACDFHLKFEDIYMSFLPLAHIMEQLIMTVVLSFGMRLGFYSGDPRRIVDDAKILQPTCMCGVPRIYQRIYDKITDQLKTLSGITKTIIDKAISDKLDNFNNKGGVNHMLWDTIAFGKIRDVLGGKIRFMLTGSAPMSKEVVDFLKIAFSTVLIEGYGGTESCAGMLLSNAMDITSGHVGGPGYANEIKLVDVPELGYLSTCKNETTGQLEPKGEICIRGPTLFKGYLNDEENTKAAIDSEGWLHTGDVGVILTHQGNAIKLIDRVKNIFKLSQGEYVAPEKLENVFMKDRYIEQIWVYGDSYQSYLIAVVVPRKESVVAFLESKGIKTTKENVSEHYENEELLKDIVKSLDKLGRDSDLKGFELVKKVYLSKEPFTVENDLVTPTMKVKRHVAKMKFKDVIDKLYK